VLAIDDAHWSDQPSLRWLAYLGRRLEGVPVLLIVGLRPPAPSADERLLGELVTDSATTVLRPGALTEDAVQTLIRTMLSAEGDPTFVSACATATSGNPFLLRELLTTLAAEGVRPQRESVALVEELGPQAASRAVSMRLSRLPSEALQLAQAVAVLGDDVDLGHAATLAGLDRDLAAHMAGALARTDILRPEHSLSFVHHVVRAAVYQELDPGEAEDAHARAASILAEAGAPAEQVAAQVLHARPSGDAGRVKVLRAAARIARGRGAPESAVAYLRRALEEPPPDELRAGVLYELGSVEKLVHGPSAAEHLREALARTTDPVQRVQTRIELARALFFSQQIEPAAEAFAAAIAELPPEDAEPRRRALAGYLFASLSDAAMLATAAPYFQEAARLDLSTSVGGSMLRAVLAFHHGRYGRATRAETIAECRLALEGDALFQEEDAAFYSLPGLLLDMADCLDESEVVWERVLAVAEQRGSIFAFAAGMGFRARTRYLRGALSDAAEDARAALEAATAHGLVTGLPYALAFLGDALVDLGRLDEAEATLAQLGLGEDVPLSTHLGFFLNARGRLRIQQARHEDGIRDLETVGRIEASCGVQNPGYTSWRPDAALGYLQLGDTERARVLVDDEVERARAWGAPRALGDGLRAAGLVAGGDEGIAMLREAVDVLGRSPSRLRHARALVDLGGALRRANHRSDAREHLRRGRELAEISGARPLTELAGAELAATGARLRTVVLSGVDALTASERRVAEMARDGLTNRQIAQSLFVTPKTVEVHLSSVYRKLGIASRNQLADALGGRPAQATAT
jgi:DNA-binding CsgD family transcriptional regulator/tetratricopeptide (TPR) repeat protein